MKGCLLARSIVTEDHSFPPSFNVGAQHRTMCDSSHMRSLDPGYSESLHGCLLLGMVPVRVDCIRSTITALILVNDYSINAHTPCSRESPHDLYFEPPRSIFEWEGVHRSSLGQYHFYNAVRSSHLNPNLVLLLARV